MSIRTIFDTCRPRANVLHGTVAEADFAADLAQVVTGAGSAAYSAENQFIADRMAEAESVSARPRSRGRRS